MGDVKQCTVTMRNGDSYVGGIGESGYCGQGTYTDKNGNVYAGIFENGKLNGHCKVTIPGKRITATLKFTGGTCDLPKARLSTAVLG